MAACATKTRSLPATIRFDRPASATGVERAGRLRGARPEVPQSNSGPSARTEKRYRTDDAPGPDPSIAAPGRTILSWHCSNRRSRIPSSVWFVRGEHALGRRGPANRSSARRRPSRRGLPARRGPTLGLQQAHEASRDRRRRGHRHPADQRVSTPRRAVSRRRPGQEPPKSCGMRPARPGALRWR